MVGGDEVMGWWGGDEVMGWWGGRGDGVGHLHMNQPSMFGVLLA